jgi:hypothetical protein
LCARNSGELSHPGEPGPKRAQASVLARENNRHAATYIAESLIPKGFPQNRRKLNEQFRSFRLAGRYFDALHIKSCEKCRIAACNFQVD